MLHRSRRAPVTSPLPPHPAPLSPSRGRKRDWACIAALLLALAFLGGRLAYGPTPSPTATPAASSPEPPDPSFREDALQQALTQLRAALEGLDPADADAALDGAFPRRAQQQQQQPQPQRGALVAEAVAAAPPLPSATAADPTASSLDPTTGLPLPSTIRCVTQGDASEFCEYTNVCVDVPGPSVKPSDHLSLLLLGDAAADAALRAAPGSPEEAAAPPHLLAHFAGMRTRHPGWGLTDLAEQGLSSGFDENHVDTRWARQGVAAKSRPFGARLATEVVPPASALPWAVPGGTWHGDVAWLDSFWMVPMLAEEHVWTCSASMCGPLASALLFNASADGGLPPLHNLLLQSTTYGFRRTTAWDGWWQSNVFIADGQKHRQGWCWAFLKAVVAHFAGGAAPFMGSGRAASEAPGRWFFEYRARARLEEAEPAPALASLLYDWVVARPGAGPPPAGVAADDEEAARVARMAAGEPPLPGTGAFADEEGVEEWVRGLLAPCVAGEGDGGAGAPTHEPPAPPGAFPAPTRHGFDFELGPANGRALAFSTNETAAWTPGFLAWRRFAWCAARALAGGGPRGRAPAAGAGGGGLPFSSLFFRDARGGVSGDGEGASQQRSAGAAPRVVWTPRDLPVPPIASAALRVALEQAVALLGEDVSAAWGAALAAEVGARAGGASSAPSPPLVISPFADAALGALAATPALSHLGDWLVHGRPLRVCARRAVVTGMKDHIVGGISEAETMREIAHAARIRAAPDSYAVPPVSVLPPRAPGDQPVPLGNAPPGNGGEDGPPLAPILLLDRGQTSNGFSVVGKWGRRFENLPDMLAVLKKYGLNFTHVEDPTLVAMSFEDQAALFNSHKLLIMAHGAGMVNTLFMPRRSAIIEVTPYGMYCPLFFRQNVFSGHFVFPIHSLINSPAQDYSYILGHTNPGEAYDRELHYYRTRCELRGHFTQAVTNGLCFHMAKTVSTVTPIDEFEATLLHALDAVGMPLQHRGAAHHLMQGLPSEEEWAAGRVPLLHHTQPGYFKNRSWHLCPPRTECAAVGGGARRPF
jgi:hypothetical protein